MDAILYSPMAKSAGKFYSPIWVGRTRVELLGSLRDGNTVVHTSKIHTECLLCCAKIPHTMLRTCICFCNLSL